MSYDISLVDPVTKETLRLDAPHFMRGGTYALNGTDKAIEALSAADDSWAEEKIKDAEAHGVTGYWLPTRENAMKPLYQLVALARARPDGVWLIE